MYDKPRGDRCTQDRLIPVALDTDSEERVTTRIVTRSWSAEENLAKLSLEQRYQVAKIGGMIHGYARIKLIEEECT